MRKGRFRVAEDLVKRVPLPDAPRALLYSVHTLTSLLKMNALLSLPPLLPLPTHASPHRTSLNPHCLTHFLPSICALQVLASHVPAPELKNRATRIAGICVANGRGAAQVIYGPGKACETNKNWSGERRLCTWRDDEGGTLLTCGGMGRVMMRAMRAMMTPVLGCGTMMMRT